MNIELLYDEPVIGENKFGNYFLYAVKSGEEEYSFFAPETVHGELQSFKRGEHAIITKLAANRNGKLVTTYAVEKPAGMKQPYNNKAGEPAKSGADASSKPAENADRYFEIMLKSYKDALSINENLNGLIDVSKVAITLFIARSRLPFNGN